MEIYKDLNQQNKEFANMLNSQTNSKIEEGKILGHITKISSKYCWVYLDGLKSEPVST